MYLVTAIRMVLSQDGGGLLRWK